MPPSPVFMKMDPATASDPSAPYAVLPAPYERTVCFGQGTAEGPAAILRASQEVEDFDEELRVPVRLRVQTLPALDFHGLSDEAALESIRAAAREVAAQRRFLLTLGGEHTIAAPLVEAFQSVYGSLSVLHIDAHADLRTEYRGIRWSHACALRRVRELGVPTVSVGIRSLSLEEYDYIRTEHVPVTWAAEIDDASDVWVDAVLVGLKSPVYVTLDVDGMDTAIMPGTGTPEPGGLTWRQITKLLRRLCHARHVVGADIVEVAPFPGSVVSEFTAARLAAKLFLYHQQA